MTVLTVVHCVDTEGPLDESLEATFLRLKEIYGVDIDPTVSNLEKIQKGIAPFLKPHQSEEAARTFSSHNLSYLRNWAQVDEVLEDFFSENFRDRFIDDFGQPWITSWFVMDHENYQPNPRKKAIGRGVIHRHYQEFIDRFSNVRDEIQYHFHPSSVSENPVGAATNYSNSLQRINTDLAMRLITFDWFPSTFRPGFHSIRPDSHLWIEQWFPFDFSNQSYETRESQPDFSGGRFGDWRRAPRTWRGYRPSLSDYQKPGSLERTIFRCLNVGTRVRELRTDHLHQAFTEASDHGSAVLAFTDHDFRDIRKDVSSVVTKAREVQRNFPTVRLRFATASDAARQHLGKSEVEPQLELSLDGSFLVVEVNRSELHSHQPFLAIETRDGAYLHDNLDQGNQDNIFTYTFDPQTIPLNLVKNVGVAVVGKNGKTATAVIAP